MSINSDVSVPGTITVVTFNLWGIFNSKHRAARMAHFAKKVSRYDVMLLQEQFSVEDFDIIINHLSPEVRESRYFRRFPSAFYGSGIAVISRFPINSAFFYTFPLQGFPERVLHGDYYANKGVSLVRLNVPVSNSSNGDIISKEVFFYSTHLVAVYEKSAKLRDWGDEIYLPVRLSQLISMADFISQTSNPENYIIIGGDFNATQRSMEVQTMLILLRQRGYILRSVIPPPSSHHLENLEANEISLLTFSHENIFTSVKEGWLVQGGDVPMQIDHLFFSANNLRLSAYEDCPDARPFYPFYFSANDAQSPSGVIIFTENEVRVPQRKTIRTSLAAWFLEKGQKMHFSPFIAFGNYLAPTYLFNAASDPPATHCPLSDHYGVAARVQIITDDNNNNNTENNNNNTENNNNNTENNTNNNNNNRGSRRAAVPLTEMERMVMRQATAYLTECVNKYNAESKMGLFFAASTAGLILANIFIIVYNIQRRKRHTSHVLEHIHSLISTRAVLNAKNSVNTATRGEKGEGENSLITVFNWISTSLRLSQPKKEDSGLINNNEGELNYEEIADHLHKIGFWSFIQPAVSITGGIISFGSLAISLLQRRADANILEEQARQMRRDGFHE